MATTPSGKFTTDLRDILEHAAGYHIRPQTGTTALLFGACAVEAHGRCKNQIQLGVQGLVCSCPCHEEQAEAFDNLYGAPWWAARVDEGE